MDRDNNGMCRPGRGGGPGHGEGLGCGVGLGCAGGSSSARVPERGGVSGRARARVAAGTDQV
jgi:hypothetical protein